MEMEREQQLLMLIKLQEEIIGDQEAKERLEKSLEQKKAFAATLRNITKPSKTQLYKQSLS